MKIIRDPKVCYGCRFCELICSFHYRAVFSSGGGTIKVFKENRTGEIIWRMDSTCDLCEGEEQPLCVKYCSYKALSVLKEA